MEKSKIIVLKKSKCYITREDIVTVVPLSLMSPHENLFNRYDIIGFIRDVEGGIFRNIYLEYINYLMSKVFTSGKSKNQSFENLVSYLNQEPSVTRIRRRVSDSLLRKVIFDGDLAEDLNDYFVSTTYDLEYPQRKTRTNV